MYIIIVDPTNYEMRPETVSYCNREDKIQAHVEVLATRYPKALIDVYKLQKRHSVKISIKTTSYIFTDKGELVPE